MARFDLTRRAAVDFDEIAEYTIHRWGEQQAVRYLADLNECFVQLAENPALGRRCDEVAPQLRRIKQGRHVVYFRVHGPGVRILRILHERMLPERHLGDHDDEPGGRGRTR